jgi:selenoprotein W-related protein
LIKSDGGVFEVVVDGKKIFSKKETGRFPEHDEIFSVIEKL